jgi:hypothetical protein
MEPTNDKSRAEELIRRTVKSMIANEPRQILSNKRNKKDKRRRRSSNKNQPDGDIESKSTSGKTRPTVGGKEEAAAPKEATKRDHKRKKLGNFPYPTDYNDHFETPKCAYYDILPLMEIILARKQKNAESQNKQGCTNEKIIYDPYYCTGRAVTLLNDVLQHTKISTPIRIQHEKRDFYRDIKQNTVPQYDILVTNPPYSGDHKEQCLDFAVSQLKKYGRPFFLLMPNYVAMKEYFRKTVLNDNDGSGSKKEVQTFYIAPSSMSPYEYDHPDGTGYQVPPFASVWYCGLAYMERTSQSKSVIDTFVKFHSLRDPSRKGTPRIVKSLQELISIGGVSGERRKNPRQRRKMLQQAMMGSNRDATAVGSVGVNTGDTFGVQSTNKRRKSGIDIEHRRKEGSGVFKKSKFA